jgi:uncharacterized protein YqgQ
MLIIIFVLLLFLSACISEPPEDETEQYEQTEGENHMSESTISAGTDIFWASDQALPIFASPADTLHTLHTSAITPDERVTISALQGIVNKTKPRILLTEDGDIPPDTWVKTFGLNTSRLDPHYMIELYKDEIKGLVVYNITNSAHYRNAAATIANINGYIPVTGGVRNVLVRQDVEFENIIDITG